MNILSDRPLFAVDGEVFHWADVVLHAHASGRWEELQAETREGLACESHFDTIEEDGAEEAIDDAAAEFRYDRELITAEEMEAWLDARGITPEEWMGYIRRVVLRQRWAGDLAEIMAEHAVEDAEVEGALRVDLLCSGTHRILAQELAVEAAAAAASSPTSPSSPPSREGQMAAIRDRALQFRRHAVAPETLAREVLSNQMEWIRVDCQAIGFREEGQAREAALLLREDELDIAEVAGEADVPIEEVVIYLDQLDPEQHSRFLGATVNDVIGPVKGEDDVYTVYQVIAKVMPSVDDPEIVRRAGERLLARLLASEVNKRVRWHADL